jgi:hypothetical protein
VNLWILFLDHVTKSLPLLRREFPLFRLSDNLFLEAESFDLLVRLSSELLLTERAQIKEELASTRLRRRTT